MIFSFIPLYESGPNICHLLRNSNVYNSIGRSGVRVIRRQQAKVGKQQREKGSEKIGREKELTQKYWLGMTY